MADPRAPSWGVVFDTILGARLRGLHTSMLGEIRAYSAAAVTAEVTLAVQLEGTDGAFETLPPLSDVPVLWPGAWAAGDACLLVFCEESFAKWFATGSVERPEVLRRHGLHAVCIPLVARAGQPVQFVALANLVVSRLEAMQAQIDSHVHMHSPGPSPPAPTGPAISAPPITPILWPTDSVAAEKVQAR